MNLIILVHIIKMKYKYFLNTLLLVILSLSLNAQDHSVHKKWELSGADERIQQNRKGDVVLEFILDDKINKRSKSSIELDLKNHDFKFGVSFTQLRRFWGQDYGDLYLERFKEVFNYATIGMYWQLTDERSNSKFMDNYYKGILEWTKKNDIRVKGHPLMWHEAMPNWVRNYKNIDELDGIIKAHMKRLIDSYPQINDWDVYNEPIGPFKPHIPPSSITKWIKQKGGIYPAMVEIYEYVNSVNPNKNYSNNHYHAKDPEFFKINEFFIEKDLNFSSIGMQAHMQSNDNVMSEEQLWNQIEDYAVLGKNIQFTEITVTSSERFKNWKDHQVFLAKRDEVIAQGGELDLESKPEYEEYQSEYLKDFYTLAFSHPSVTSITFWNMTDKNAWRGHAGGLLFKDLKPKKAFNTLKYLVKEKWNTQINKNIDSNVFKFNGFYGKYQGKIIVRNKEYDFEFYHSKSNKDPIKIYL